MKPHTSWHLPSRAALGFALALATPAAVTADPTPPAAPPAVAVQPAQPVQPLHPLQAAQVAQVVQVPKPAPAATPRLLSVEVLQQYELARRKNIQSALKFIFADDPAYLAAYKQTGAPLSDQVVGPITLSFIARFWTYYNLDPAGSLTDASVDVMLKFAERLKARPEWRADLVSARFGHWIDQQTDRVELYRIRLAVDPVLLPPVLKRYHAVDFALVNGVDTEDEPLAIYWYGLTMEDLAAIGSQAVFPEKMLKPLAPLTAFTYATASDLAEDVRKALRPSGQDAAALIAQLERVAKTDDGYELTDDLLADLAKPTLLPPQLTKMFGDMIGMQYVRRSLFDQAMVQRLRIGLSACRAHLPHEEWMRRKTRLLSKEDMDALRATVNADGVDSAKADGARLGDRLYRLWDGLHCDQGGTDAAALQELYNRYSKLIAPYVRKLPDYKQAKPFLLTSNMCGCNTDKSKDEVFHFLPFWLGGPPQPTDFSLMSRLNYYGLTFDNNGDLAMGLTGQPIDDLFTGKNAEQLAFVSEARRHRVKVDWIVHRTDWRVWGAMKPRVRQALLARLSFNIVRMLSMPMTDLASRSVPWLSFGTTGVPTRGDGVTLYFDGYPPDQDSMALYAEFINDLRRRLTEGGFDLNIMLRHTEMGKGIYGYEKLSSVLQLGEEPEQPALYGWAQHNFKHAFGIPEGGQYVQPRYLVLLEEPTTEIKKQLRSEVEDATMGQARAALLRRMVPVVNFNGIAWAQLEDDLIYFDDNFGGVGFWPGTKQPEPDAAQVPAHGVARCGDLKLLEDCIQDHFRDPPGERDALACRFVCSYRLPLRFTLDILLIALAATVFAYVRWCDARPVIVKFYVAPVAAIAVAAAIFAGLMTCDPYLNNLGDGLLVPGVLVLALIAMYFYFRSILKERDARP
ncbi:hypothetical protein SAMN05428959_10350 [Duganella sp. CF517]|uniref:hypothetical protein n=1 Tax=Duganella sp. CF517 TaxID=1881038 RepID=UPI0008B3F570|nr:hypothetical protein [Duganella sp. CF517]SEN77213.1 hypothetical protein SAMN05428959_10350 [Duganella sp. CF517]